MGLVARKIEEAGIPTVTLNMIWPYQRLVGMPRVAAIEHPFGRPFGDVEDETRQREVLVASLAVATDARQPGQIHHLLFRWHEPPKETRWHPSAPSPIIALMKSRAEKKKAKSTPGS